jgi:hypothetical protein
MLKAAANRIIGNLRSTKEDRADPDRVFARRSRWLVLLHCDKQSLNLHLPTSASKQRIYSGSKSVSVFSGNDPRDHLRHADTGILAKCRTMVTALRNPWSRIEDDDACFTATVIGAGIFSCLLTTWAILWS